MDQVKLSPQANRPFSDLDYTTPTKKQHPIKRPPQLTLGDVRVIQDNLVYIINLPSIVADEEILKSYEYFGQYGKIVKCVVNRSTVYSNSAQGPSYAAYITYSTQEEAGLCIKACDRTILHGRQLSLTFGTTKYCTYFLKDTQCPKTDCLYLHKMATKRNTLPREELPNKITPQNCILEKISVIKLENSGQTVLPPAKIFRDRTYSMLLDQDLPSRPRLMSRDETRSRFPFVEDSEENSPALPYYISELVKKVSPCKDRVEVACGYIDEILSPTSPDKWAVDVLAISPAPFGQICFIEPKPRS